MNPDQVFYVHFETAGMLELFIREHKFTVGHRCCNGKGAHLIEASSHDEIDRLKRKFLNENMQRNKILTNPTIETFECPVCFEALKITKRYQTNCTHNICISCINSIKEKSGMNNNCPLCRAPFK